MAEAFKTTGVFIGTLVAALVMYGLTDLFPPYNDLVDTLNLAFGFASGSTLTWVVMKR